VGESDKGGREMAQGEHMKCGWF